MLEKRRQLLKAFAATLLTPLANTVMAAPDQNEPTADENQVIRYLADHGITRFTLLNKQRGQLLFIDDGKILSSDSALSGRIKGDNARDDLGTTPAGIHILQPYGNGTHIGYKDVGNSIDYAIHTIINPAGQKRPERLASHNAEFKRISSGCVNVSQSVMDKLHKFIDISQQVFKTDDETPYVMGSFFVVLPEKSAVSSILKYPEFSIPKAPQNN